MNDQIAKGRVPIICTCLTEEKEASKKMGGLELFNAIKEWLCCMSWINNFKKDEFNLTWKNSFSSKFHIYSILLKHVMCISLRMVMKFHRESVEIQYTDWRMYTYSRISVRCFGYFHHLPNRILKQMIHHWKALIKSC